MPDVSLDYAVLRGAVTNLEYVAKQFEASGDTASAAAAATGHQHLSGRVQEFADNWDDTRGRFRRAAEDLAKSIDEIRDAFETFDDEAASH
ncbi:hypothetical protein [uncultured Agrococcus sp.]|uniref:hypothetical protein n=1 Tax=uncultured Agrococcus sp. TaxID=382258 RepID=UPI0025D8C5C8|nr:hypothetical protein [uncultured Agrococcus sp.]